MRTITALIRLQVTLLVLAGSAAAQHSIDIQRHAAEGDYFKALTEYEKLPKRRASTGAITSAARSAWGLGMPERAIEEYDRALLDEKLATIDKARIYLSRAIIEYQEERFQTSVLYAERSVGLIEESGPLLAKALIVWGKSLLRMKLYAPAEEKFNRAIDTSDFDDKPDAHFNAALAQMHLGKIDLARENLEKVPLHHEHTPQAIRFLAQLALDKKNFTEAEFWLNKGRAEYPDSFLDSWVDYVLLRTAVNAKDEAKVRSVVEEARRKYPPSDEWFVLLEAAAEAFFWGEK